MYGTMMQISRMTLSMKLPGQVISLASNSMEYGSTSQLPSRLRQEPVGLNRTIGSNSYHYFGDNMVNIIRTGNNGVG